MGSTCTEAKFGLVIDAAMDNYNRMRANASITHHSTSLKSKEGEMGTGAQLYGDRWKLDFRGGHDGVHSDVDHNGAHLKLI